MATKPRSLAWLGVSVLTTVLLAGGIFCLALGTREHHPAQAPSARAFDVAREELAPPDSRSEGENLKAFLLALSKLPERDAVREMALFFRTREIRDPPRSPFMKSADALKVVARRERSLEHGLAIMDVGHDVEDESADVLRFRLLLALLDVTYQEDPVDIATTTVVLRDELKANGVAVSLQEIMQGLAQRVPGPGNGGAFSYKLALAAYGTTRLSGKGHDDAVAVAAGR